MKTGHLVQLVRLALVLVQLGVLVVGQRQAPNSVHGIHVVPHPGMVGHVGQRGGEQTRDRVLKKVSVV